MKKTRTWSRKIYKNGKLEKIIEVQETTITTIFHEPKKSEVKELIRYLKKLLGE